MLKFLSESGHSLRHAIQGVLHVLLLLFLIETLTSIYTEGIGYSGKGL